jgi:hypothetical protein
MASDAITRAEKAEAELAAVNARYEKLRGFLADPEVQCVLPVYKGCIMKCEDCIDAWAEKEEG